ncbi:MAG: aldo/keto reductase [Candidatus Micrarchaeales archaeon]
MITELGGKRIYPIGIGTWRMGGDALHSSNENDKKEIRAIKFSLKSGMNVIDTAEIYGRGHAEELVAEAIKGRDRDDLFIISKVWPMNLRHDSVIRAAHGSLKRLKTKYIDLYLIHWPNPLVSINETIGAMEELVDKGLVRHIGLSNFGVNEVKNAVAATKRYEIIANEISYSLIKKDAEDYLIPFCIKNKIKIIAHTPLGKGKVLKMKEVVDMAKKYDKKPAQIAINYLMKKSLPIPKASDQNHIHEITGSVGWGLSIEDYNSLSQIR